MSLFGFPAFDQLPPEIQEYIKRQHMEQDSWSHTVFRVLSEMDKEELFVLRTLLHSAYQSNGESAPYWEGIVIMTLQDKHKICAACNKNHDEELAKISQDQEEQTPIPTDPAEIGSMIEYNLVYKEGKIVCGNCGHQYASVEDRMLRKPDECPGCEQKAKWG